MVKIVNGDIEVLYEWGLPFGPMPQLVIGAVGAIMVSSAALLFFVEFVKTGGDVLPATERLVACGLLLMIGVTLTLRAVLSKARRLGSVTIGDTGITFRWKHASPDRNATAGDNSFVGWSDMEKIEWTEEGLEHEFKQYLSVTLKVPILDNTKKYRFLICDTRSYRECQALHAKIPPQAKRPVSVLTVLKQG